MVGVPEGVDKTKATDLGFKTLMCEVAYCFFWALLAFQTNNDCEGMVQTGQVTIFSQGRPGAARSIGDLGRCLYI